MFIGRNSDVVKFLARRCRIAKFLLEQVIDAYLKYDVDTKN